MKALKVGNTGRVSPRALTELQAAFVHQFTSDPATRGNGAASARAAGCGERSANASAHNFLSIPKVQTAIYAAVKERFPASVVGNKAVCRVMDDETLPAAKRMAAARTIMDLGRFVFVSAAVDMLE